MANTDVEQGLVGFRGHLGYIGVGYMELHRNNGSYFLGFRVQGLLCRGPGFRNPGSVVWGLGFRLKG